MVVSDRGEVQHPKTGKVMQPRPLGMADVQPLAGRDPRQPLAQWLTSKQNPWFARNIVNRVWRHMTGKGIVEPVDDVRVTNPPSNPALLEALAADFVANRYDLRHLIRVIAESRTYQLSSLAIDGNRHDERLFSHAYLKPLGAQVMADAVAQATDVPNQYPAEETAAVRLLSLVESDALDVLGRCSRKVDCESQTRGGGLAKALHLINGSTVNDKLRGGVVDRLLKWGQGDTWVVDELYLRTLSRFPSRQEREYCLKMIGEANQQDQAMNDLLWALLNSREFGFNH